jgi:hypothetical protein
MEGEDRPFIASGMYMGSTGAAASQLATLSLQHVRHLVTKGSGDCPAATLVDTFRGRCGEKSEALGFFNRIWDLVSSVAVTASRGEFAAELVPAGFIDEVLRDTPIDGHRKQHLEQLLRGYLEPAGKQVQRHVSDRSRGQLLPVADGATTPVEDDSVVRALLATARQQLVEQLREATQQLEEALTRASARVVPPVGARPTAAAIADLTALRDAADQAREDFTRAHPGVPTLQAVHMSHTETPASPVLVPMELRQRKTELVKASIETNNNLRVAQRLVEEWVAFEARQPQPTAAQIVRLETRVGELASNLTTSMPGRADAGQAARQSTVQAYMHQDLGLPVTPNIAVYLVVRAAFETVFVLASKLDEVGYRRQKQQQGQSLKAWGGHVEEMAKCFPWLEEDQHVEVFLGGLADSTLERDLRTWLADHPEEALTLRRIRDVANQRVNRNVNLLHLQLQGAALTPEQRQRLETRMETMHQLLGSSQGAKAAKKPKAPAAAASGAYLAAKTPFKLPQFKNRHEFDTYRNRPCLMHPKAKIPHTNGQCIKQKPDLSDHSYAFAAEMVAEVSRSTAAPAGRAVSSSYSQSLHPATPYAGSEVSVGPSASRCYAPSQASAYGLHAAPVTSHGGGRGYGQGGYEFGGAAAGRPPVPPVGRPAPPLGINRQQQQQQTQIIAHVAGLPIPAPVKGYAPCEFCGWNSGHFPNQCGYKFPHVASRNFRLPGANTAPHLMRMFQDGMQQMPPNMQAGALYAEYFRHNRDHFSPQAQESITRELRVGAGGRMEQAHFAYADLLAPEVAAYMKEQEVMGAAEPLFSNTRGASTRGAAQGSTSSSSSSSSSSSGGTRGASFQEHGETAAALPRSFLQEPELPGAGEVVRDRRKGWTGLGKGQPKEDRRLRQQFAKLRPFIPQLQELLSVLQGIEGDAAQPEPAPNPGLPPVHVAAAAADPSPSKLPDDFTASVPARAIYLRDLMKAHGAVDPTSMAQGLMSILDETRGGKRYILDSIVNDDPQQGFVIITPDGRVWLPTKAKSDTGCSTSLVAKKSMDANKIRYFPAPFRVVLADGKVGKVVGLTEPMLVVIAPGTARESVKVFQALVLEGVEEVFEILIGKDHLHQHKATVDQDSQRMFYTADSGERHSIPVRCWEVEADKGIAMISHQGGCEEVVRPSFALVGHTQQVLEEQLEEPGQQGPVQYSPGVAAWAALNPGDGQTRIQWADSSDSYCESGGSDDLSDTDSLDDCSSTCSSCEEPSDLGDWGGEEEPSESEPQQPAPAPAKPSAPASHPAPLDFNQPNESACTAASVPQAKAASKRTLMDYRGFNELVYTPPLYYRAASYFSTLIVLVVGALCFFPMQVVDCFLPFADFFGYFRSCFHPYWLGLVAWWQAALVPVSDYAMPPPQRVAARSRKHGDDCWYYGLMSRRVKHKPPTSTQARRLRVYLSTITAHTQAVRRHVAVLLVTTFSLRGFRVLYPLLVLLCVSAFSAVVASPEGVQGMTCLTDNLAAWELSRLAGWRFRPSRRLQRLTQVWPLPQGAAVHVCSCPCRRVTTVPWCG